jgi:hypothetical protein
MIEVKMYGTILCDFLLNYLLVHRRSILC